MHADGLMFFGIVKHTLVHAHTPHLGMGPALGAFQVLNIITIMRLEYRNFISNVKAPILVMNFGEPCRSHQFITSFSSNFF